jgi:hypothetical protein
MSVFVKNLEAKNRNGNVFFIFGDTKIRGSSGEFEEKAYSQSIPSTAATISNPQV